MKKLAVVFATAGLLSFGTFASSESIVSDSFESGDFSAPGAPEFKWSSYTPTPMSIVTETSLVFQGSPVNELAPPTSQWEAKSGKHALRFLYPAGEDWVEQRFTLSKPQPDIWMSFWLRVPTNYSHPQPKRKSDNQKLFNLWMDGYSYKGEGSTVGMEFRGSGDGSSYFYGKVSPGGYNVTGSDQGRASFIQIPRDRGKWMHLVVHIASENSPGASDGSMEVWRKWKGDFRYTKTHDLQDQKIRLSSSVKGFTHGYLMGWANAVYPTDTEFLIDDFELSTTPLFSSPNAPSSPLVSRLGNPFIYYQ